MGTAELLLETPDAGATMADRWLPLLQQLKALRWITPGEQLVATEPVGDGNMNRTLRIRLESDEGSRSLVLKQALPYVAKYPAIAAPVERGAVEAAFYRQVTANAQLSGHMPKLLGFAPDQQLLALEDLGTAQDFSLLYDQAHKERGHYLEQLPALMDWLLALHSMAAPADFPGNHAMRALNHEHLFEVPFAAEPVLDFPAPLAALRNALREDQRLASRLRELGRRYRGGMAARETDLQDPAVLLHGDYYPGSWLLNGKGGLSVIDPEFAFVGPAAFDLGVFAAHLALAGLEEPVITGTLERYAKQRPFDTALMAQFRAVEVLRRCFGVAQLPLTLTAEELVELCENAWKTLSA